jgi:hypothetical protein
MPVTQNEFEWIMQRVEELIKVRQQPLLQKIIALQQQMRTASEKIQQQQNASDVTEFEVDYGVQK